MSSRSSVSMEISEGPSPWGTSPPTHLVPYFTNSKRLVCESPNHEDAVLDEQSEDSDSLPDYAVTLDSHSTDSIRISKLLRSPLKETQCYDELHQLGHGGNGNCFLVQRRSDRELRVCKVIPSKPEYKDYIPGEAEVLKFLLPPHDRIVRMHEVFNLPYSAEMYFDYYEGGDLDQLIDQYFDQGMMLSENFIWHCYLQLSEALAYIHTGYNAFSQTYEAPLSGGEHWLPVIHGDIKPLNIFVKPSPDGSFPSLVLGDFGNSRIQPGRSYLGTIAWMPPELPEYSVKSDIWGVGAVIHALCHNGRPPMRPFPRNLAPTPTNVESWSFSPNSRYCEPVGTEYSETLRILLNMHMQWKPSDRPSSKQLLVFVEREVSDRFRHSTFSSVDWSTIGRRRKRPYLYRAFNPDPEPSFDFGPSEPVVGYAPTSPTYSEEPQLYPANSPPPPPNDPQQQQGQQGQQEQQEEEINRPRYLTSLPSRNAYWLQDAQGNWFTGNEPVQPLQPLQPLRPDVDMNMDMDMDTGMDIQPYTYADNEPTHHAVSPPPPPLSPPKNPPPSPPLFPSSSFDSGPSIIISPPPSLLPPRRLRLHARLRKHLRKLVKRVSHVVKRVVKTVCVVVGIGVGVL